jgi:hypothetical protein
MVCYIGLAVPNLELGLYYFSAKLANPRHSALASWVTGWANVTGQISLVCSIDFTCAQMITTAITVRASTLLPCRRLTAAAVYRWVLTGQSRSEQDHHTGSSLPSSFRMGSFVPPLPVF